jgi:hypothetical protein
VGGVLWLDWRNEFEASEHIGRQIVGHTTVKMPDVVHMNTDKESWNLDTEKDYGVIIDGMMVTRPIPAWEQKVYNLNKNALHISRDTVKWD